MAQVTIYYLATWTYNGVAQGRVASNAVTRGLATGGQFADINTEDGDLVLTAEDANASPTTFRTAVPLFVTNATDSTTSVGVVTECTEFTINARENEAAPSSCDARSEASIVSSASTTLTSTDATSSALSSNGASAETTTISNVPTNSNATSPTTASRSPSPTTTQTSGITNAEAAGVGIGSAVLGALLAAAIVFCLMRRRRKHTAPRGTPSNTARGVPSAAPTDGSSLGKYDNKGDAVSALSPCAADMDLPPPEEDRAIAGSISRLETMIKNHAQSFYAGSQDFGVPLAGDPLSNHLQQLLGNRAPIKAEAMMTLLAKSRSRVGAVRFLLAWTILESVDVHALPEHSLLPPELIGFVRTSQSIVKDQPALYSRWRFYSGLLLRHFYGSKTLPAADVRQQIISKTVARLDLVLRSFATMRTTSNAEQTREQNMEEIVRLGAQSGYTLFIQPTTWKLEWTDRRVHSDNELVVFPALFKIGDEQGRMYTPDMYHAFGHSQTMDVGRVLR